MPDVHWIPGVAGRRFDTRQLVQRPGWDGDRLNRGAGRMSVRRTTSSRRGLVGDDRGIAAVEFALLAPIFCLLMAGVIDLGGVLFTKFQLDAAVTAGANFAQVNASNV